MSSDSEDDCYGNIALKLQLIKSKYEVDTIKTTTLLDSPQAEPHKTVDKTIEIADNITYNTCEVSKNDSDCEEMSLDTIIAQNSKKRNTRKSKRVADNADISTDNIISTRGRKTRKSSKTNPIKAPSSIDVGSPNASDLSVVELNDSVNSSDTTSNRSRGRRRGRKTANTTSTSNVNTRNTTDTTNEPINIRSMRSNTARTSRAPRGRRSNSRRDQISLPDFLSAMLGYTCNSYPTYSVGNTDEYPDESQNQPLFTDQSKKDDIIIDAEDEPMNDSLDDNEELSVKVYWQNSECVKFTIRRYQKLQSIFDFFADREKVSHDKLFFTYNDKILKTEDTPDSITYSIVKFIDGGIVNQSVLKIVQSDRTVARDGIKLKFQCQNLKKPYEVYVRPEDKLASALMQCAEHLEKPLEKLKFIFDGEVISGKNTPRELDLEGGECIDVKMLQIN